MKRALRLLAVPLLLSAAACTPRFEPAGAPVAPPRLSETRVIASDGAELPLRIWRPAGRPRAAILGLHGFNDYSNAFDGPANSWAGDGIVTYAYDQRGFGAAPHPGIWSGHPTMARDAAAAATLIRARHPDLPLFVVGESMGAAVAMVAATEHGMEANGLVLVAPALRGRRYLGAVPRAALWLFSRLVPGLPLTGRGLKIRASDNIEMLRALGADPLVLKESRIDTIRGLVDLMDAAGLAAPRLRTPSLTLYGARDELIPPRPTWDMIRALPDDVAHRAAVYETGWHMLLRDLEAEIVRADIAAWTREPAAPLPSGADRKAAKALRDLAR